MRLTAAVDLHMHTYFSDGLLSPEALLQLCQRQGLERVAVTDHDSVGGLERAAAEARRLGLSLVPGVELTARFSGEMHILGYGIRPADCGLADFLQEQLLRRARRNTQMVERLRELGMPLTEEDMRQEAGREEYGRTHMARVMVKRGVCHSIDEAFRRFLLPGQPGYVSREKPPSAQCIAVIRGAGGDAVLAHPGLMGLPDYQLEPVISQLRGEGLAGVEAFYPQHTPGQTAALRRMAGRMGLIATYGSDYHGKDRSGEELLMGWKRRTLPAATLQAAARWSLDEKEDDA